MSRERNKVNRNGREEILVRTSLIQVRLTATKADGQELGPDEINFKINSPGIIPPIDPKQVHNYVPTKSNMVPITFGTHIIDVNKKAIDKFRELSGVSTSLKAQLSKLYKIKNGVDVPITVLKLFPSNKKIVNNPGYKSIIKGKSGPAYRSNYSVGASVAPEEEELKHHLAMKSTEVNYNLNQLGRSWARYKPKDQADADIIPVADYVPSDMNEIASPDLLWSYLNNNAKDTENIIEFEYGINEDRWLELKRASNTFHINNEMWPDVTIKAVYRMQKETGSPEITYYVRALGKLVKTGTLTRGIDVNNIIQLMNHDRKMCVGVLPTPYLKLIHSNVELSKLLRRDALLVLNPFESLHSTKCCGIVRDVSQMHTNSFKRGSVGIEGEQVVCPPCMSLCARLNQLFSSKDFITSAKKHDQVLVT